MIMPIAESDLFPDDEKLIADMLKNQWSLEIGDKPNIEYIPESFMMDAGRVGTIYVYSMSASEQVSSTDYATLRRTVALGIRLSTRNREQHFEYGREIRRILAANRRAGQGKEKLKGYTYLEVNNIRRATDLNGWYTTTFDIRLITFNLPLRSEGFGPYIEDTNKQFGVDNI